MIDESYVLYPQYRIREICGDYGIPILDLTETLYRNGGTTLFKDYLHLNGEGNNLVAAALESYLADNLPVLNDTGKPRFVRGSSLARPSVHLNR
jgi:hypothetical protein